MTKRYTMDSEDSYVSVTALEDPNGEFVRYSDYEKTINTLKLLTLGHWEAYLHNSWRRGDDQEWGEFATKGEAETEAKYQYDREISPDSTLYWGAKFVFDHDEDSLHDEAVRTLRDLGEL